MGARHVVFPQDVGQYQIVDMALVTGDKDNRSPMGGDFNPVEAVMVHRDAVKHRVDDPSDDRGKNADDRRIVLGRDTFQVGLCPPTDLLNRQTVFLRVARHGVLERIGGQYAFFQLLL